MYAGWYKWQLFWKRCCVHNVITENGRGGICKPRLCRSWRCTSWMWRSWAGVVRHGLRLWVPLHGGRHVTLQLPRIDKPNTGSRWGRSWFCIGHRSSTTTWERRCEESWLQSTMSLLDAAKSYTLVLLVNLPTNLSSYDIQYVMQ